jgi:putative transposase
MSHSRFTHRKRVRHYHDASHCHELTFSCYRRLPLLTNHIWRGLLSESIERATVRHNYRLSAFVFMPEHVHLLLYPGQNASNIDALLKAIKRPFSFRIKTLLSESNSPLLERLTIQQRPGSKHSVSGKKVRATIATLTGPILSWQLSITSIATRSDADW